MSRIIAYSVLIFIVGSIILVMKNESEGINSKWDEDQNDSILIKLPLLNVVIGVINTIFFLVALLYVVFVQKETDVVSIAFISLFVIGSFSLVVAYFNWKILLKNDYFIYRTFFKNTYIFSYVDIVKIKLGPNIVMIKAKEKWLFMDSHGKGMEHFVNKINQAFENENDKERNTDGT